MRFLRLAGLTLAWVIIFGLSAWAIAALYIDMPTRWQIALATAYVLGLIAILIFARVRLLRMALSIILFVIVLTWWLSLKPSDDRPWQTDVARTAWAEINSDIVTIHNVRNFDYRTETDYQPRWETRTYDLSQLQAVDLFVTFWGSPWIAHPILSFQFSSGDHVAFSVETRKEIGEEYSALLGFFRQYELIYIVADERDVIRLRANYRVDDEQVYLYRTTAAPDAARAVFLDYLRSVNALHAQPRFYNAITSNCTTNIRLHTGAASTALPPWDWRLLLNGKGDEFAYQYGKLAGDLPFDELKQRAHINDAAQAADQSPDFSALIRIGRPGFSAP